MGLRLKRYGPVRTMFVVGWFPRAGVPAARSARTENKNKRMEAKTIAPPMGTAAGSATGSGQSQVNNAPAMMEIEYTSGGRTQPRLATSGLPPEFGSFARNCIDPMR